MLEAQIPKPPAEPPPQPIPGVPPIRPPDEPPKPPIEEPPPPVHAPHQKPTDAQVGQLLPIACPPAPRCHMAAASAFHLVNLSADTKATDGLHEMEVVETQQAE